MHGHLRILEYGIACQPEDTNLHNGKGIVSWERLDEVDCDECKASIYFEAAERMANVKALQSAALAKEIALNAAQPRIPGRLGASAVYTEDMTPADRLRARAAAMTPEEKIESLTRIVEFAEDTCPSCAGSIQHDEHSEDCLGPDPDQWHEKLTDEQVRAELMVAGVDPDKAASRFRTFLDGLEKKHGG